MDLLEYQAKQLFDEVGIPTLPSQTIDDSREIKKLQIPYPVVLKSQVRAGGRSRAGGIRFVENTIDAIAAARAIFNLPILGEYPQVLMAEARYDAKREFFLAVVLDYQLQFPVLLGSASGGINIEALLDNMQKVVVEEEFSAFYARRLAIKMGLQGVLLQSVSAILEKMYHLFVVKDLDIIEINPLGVSTDGEIMALDGKITVNDRALKRHPDLISLAMPKPSFDETSDPEPRLLEGFDDKGNIGIICNSALLAQATWDLIAQEKGKLACCLIVGETDQGELLSASSLALQMEQALERALAVPGLKTLLINVLGGTSITEAVAQAVERYWQPQIEQVTQSETEERTERATGGASRRRKSRSSPRQEVELPQWVVRLAVAEIEPIREHLAAMPIHWNDDLESAVSQTISLAKSK